MKGLRGILAAAAAAWIIAATGAASAAADPLAVNAFARDTGMVVDATKIQQTWQALQAMGTTKYLGGSIGGLKLDEASMLAGALTVGVTEFDQLLNGSGINVATAGIGTLLSQRMNSAAGINLSSLTGSYTQNIGATGTVSASAMAGTSGAAVSGGACSPRVAQALSETGKSHVDMIMNAAMSKEYGFSQLSDIKPGAGSGTGFAALGCLEKLFQNAGSDILFKPPSLGSLTAQLENWTCGAATPITEQIAGAFGNGERFETSAYGGFFPRLTYGEANEANPAGDGMGNTAEQTFGGRFAASLARTGTQITDAADVMKIFR